MNEAGTFMSDSGVSPTQHARDVVDGMHIRLFTLDAPVIAAGAWKAQNVQSAYWRLYRNDNNGAFLSLPGGDRCALEAGRAYLVPAGVRFSCGSACAFAHFYVHFDVIGPFALFLRGPGEGPILLPPNAAFASRAQELAGDLRAGCARDLAVQCRAKALVYDGLGAHLATAGADRWVRRAAALEPLAPALRHIEEKLGQAITLADLAALCCLSSDHFARRFKACVGETPGRYLLERRVARAAQQLLFTNDSIEAIAARTGFSNRFYFSRVFVRATGLGPAAYRKATARV